MVSTFEDILDEVNAGHGLHTGNLPGLLRVPHLDTLNIGHSLVARSVFVGLGEAVREMRAAIAERRFGAWRRGFEQAQPKEAS